MLTNLTQITRKCVYFRSRDKYGSYNTNSP